MSANYLSRGKAIEKLRRSRDDIFAILDNIEYIRGRMVSKCRRYIFGCFDSLPRNIISWIKIHQLILVEKMPENFEHFKYLSKFCFPSVLVVLW